MNLFGGEMRNGSISTAVGTLPVAARPAATAARKVVVGVRSEDVRVGVLEGSEAKVHDVENHGVEKIVTLLAGGQLFRATVPATLDLGIDGVVNFGFDSAKLHCFDAETGIRLEH
jgi:multiple sugar transport system ATP-binding protein